MNLFVLANEIVKASSHSYNDNIFSRFQFSTGTLNEAHTCTCRYPF